VLHPHHRSDPHNDSPVMVTTKTFHAWKTVDGITIGFVPPSLYAYVLGKDLSQRHAEHLFQNSCCYHR
jgi:hypothetical protein